MEKALVSSASILIGMVVGYVVCIPFGMVDFSAIVKQIGLQFLNIFEYGVNFDLKFVLPFIPAYFVSIIGTVGCLKAIGEASQI